MNNLTILGGSPAVVLILVVMIALPITALVSFWLLHRYRNAVEESMKQAVAQAQEVTDRRPDQNGPPVSLQIRRIDRDRVQVVDEQATRHWQHSQRSVQQIALAYGLAGVGQALLLLILYFVMGGVEFRPVRTLLVLLVFAGPIIPALLIIGVGGSRARWLMPLSYLLLAFLLAPAYFPQFMALWALFMGPPTLMFLMVGHRRLRAVAPLVVVVVCLFLFTLLAIPDLMLWLLPANRFVANLSPFLALSGAGLLAWWTVRWFAQRYQKKQASDQMLQLDAWWLLATLFMAVLISSDGNTLGFLLALATFGLFKGLLAWRLRPLAQAARQHGDRRLLLLRVFGFQGRSESLLAAVGVYWRTLGSIQMIAGADLATATLEPHEFFAYINGRLSRQFVKDATDLAQRMMQVDRQPDPDGRFRVNEFFCHDDTWRMTLQRLVKESHVVLMDLRGFGPQNAGCRYELGQLVDLVPIERAVFLIDGTTDEAYLTQQLHFMWQTMATASPNWLATAPTTVLFHIENQGDRTVELLLRLLLSNAVAETPEPLVQPD